MNIDLTTDAARRADGREPPTSAFVVTAQLEFEASLQLLAERARFLTAATGTAIAVAQGGVMVYCAASGVSVPDPGTTVDLNRVAIRTCLEGGRASWIEPGAGFGFGLVVPVLEEQKVLGLVELVGQFPLEDREQQTISRIAEMVGVALEHRDAAFAVERAMAPMGNGMDMKSAPEVSHAETSVSPPALSGIGPAPSLPTASKVQTCAACGFPVSDRRTLCVDCEQNSAHAVRVQLFSSHPEESWLSTHGYAIASIVVSALAALIIFWLLR